MRHPQGAKPGPQNTSCSDVPVPDTVRGNAYRGAWRKGYLRGSAGLRADNPYVAAAARDGKRYRHATYNVSLARAYQAGYDDGWIKAKL